MNTDLESIVAQNVLGLDLAGLRFGSMGIAPSEAKSRPVDMTVFEIGLSEFFACLVIQTIWKSNVPTDSWILLRQTDSIAPSLNSAAELYCLSYSERAARAVEEAIRLADNLTAVISAIKYAQGKTKEAKVPLTIEQVQRIAEKQAKANIRRRNKMWAEIDHGLHLLLSDRNNPNNPEPNGSVILQRLDFRSMEDNSMWNIGCLVLHGHQLRKWVRQPQLFRLPEEVEIVMLGHYHIQMAAFRHGLWIIFTGHFKQTLSGKYVLSHRGTPKIDVSPGMQHFQFVIDRS